MSGKNLYMSQSHFLDGRSPPHISTLAILAGVSAMNMSIFLPSLPSMANDFDVDYGTMQIFISGYFLSLAFFQLIIGPVSDRIGRKPTMIAAFVLFTPVSYNCTAQNKASCNSSLKHSKKQKHIKICGYFTY